MHAVRAFDEDVIAAQGAFGEGGREGLDSGVTRERTTDGGEAWAAEDDAVEATGLEPTYHFGV